MFDIYAAITDRIIAKMENGIIPWHKPWTTRLAVSHATGEAYRGINRFLLDPGEYITFSECEKEGGKVKKGEKAHMVVFWKFLDKKDKDGKVVIGDDGKPEKIPFLRYFNVFEISQCEGIERKYPQVEAVSDIIPSEKAENIANDYISRSGVKVVKTESNQAYYSPSQDLVNIPVLDQFSSIAEYYSTYFHELAHSTGHSSRLNRITKPAFFGSDDYSKEELVAEITASAVVSFCGLETEGSFNNNAAYIQHWLNALRNDKKMIVSAAGQAEKAFALLANPDSSETENVA